MYKLFNFNFLQKKQREKERRRDNRVKQKMCLNRKHKMHMCTFWQNVQWWCSCTIIYNFYIKYSILFTLFHITFFSPYLAWFFYNRMEQNEGRRWSFGLSVNFFLYIYMRIYICHSIRSLDKVAVCCGGEEGYHTYATVIYIITVWRVRWLGYTS